MSNSSLPTYHFTFVVRMHLESQKQSPSVVIFLYDFNIIRMGDYRSSYIFNKFFEGRHINF